MNEIYCMTYPERHTIACGKCGERHSSAKGVAKCYAGAEITSCTFIVRLNEYSEDGERYVYECLADSWYTDRGWECANGHSDVRAEVRQQEGWDYAADEGEAYLLRLHGVNAVGMDGGSI
jgi:hypothetical protein